MTDKVQKIKDWISEAQDYLMDAQGNFEYPEHEGAYLILCELDTYIDSLQGEPVSRTPADIESAMQEVEEKSRAFTEAHQEESSNEILAQMRGEEPVSEDLEEEIEEYWKNAPTGTVYFPMWEHFQIIAHHFAEWGKKQAEIEIQAQSMAPADGCPKEFISEDLEAAAKNVGQKYFPNEYNIWARPNYEAVKAECAFKDGAKWQQGKTLSDVKKAVTGKAFQFSMENVEAWGDDSNGETIKLKGRVTFQVNNPESIIDALFAELENDKQE